MTRARRIAHAGVIAAVYAALTLIVIQNPLGYGPVQFRLSEAFTVVACLTPAAIPGLWVGALVANAAMLAQFGALALFDVVFGSIASALGAIWTWRFRARPVLALLGPVVTNALIVPAYLPVVLSQVSGLNYYEIPALGIGAGETWLGMYVFGVLFVGIGQAVVVYGLGLPVLALLRRTGVARMFGEPSGEDGTDGPR